MDMEGGENDSDLSCVLALLTVLTILGITSVIT